MNEMQKVLIVEVMADLTQLELDNLRHEIENLVGVFSVNESQPTSRALDLCQTCGGNRYIPEGDSFRDCPDCANGTSQ